MSMRFKIFQSVPYTDSKGITYRNHKVFIKNKPYWISEKDFVNHPELLIIRNENLELKVPTESYYSYVKNTNKKGQYFLIIPTESVDNEMTTEMDPKPLILGKGNIIKNKNLKALTVEKSDKSEVKTKAYSKESLKKKEIALLGEPFCNHPPGSYKITIKFKDGVINTFYILRTRENINVRAVNDRSEEKILSGDQLELFTSGKFAPYMLAGDSVENLIFEISSLGEYQESGGSLGVIEKEEIKKVENTKLKSTKRDKSIKQEVQSHKDNSVTILEDFMDVVDVFTEEIHKIEPESKRESSIGNKNIPSSSFKSKWDTLMENNPTDSSNIFLEEFKDVNDLFPEEPIESIKEPSPVQTTIKDIFAYPIDPQKSPLEAKIQFINGLVAMASREKINNRLRERLFNLVSKELDGQRGREDKIFEEINNIKKILMDGIGPVKPPVESGRKENPHTPRSTAIFLSNFKYDNDSRLKELIHRPDESYKIDSGLKELIHKPDEFTDYQNLNDLLLKVKNHPALSSAFGYRNKSNFESIHLEVRSAAISLIKEFETVIRSQEKGQVIHPFAQSPVFRQYAEDFKRNFRFGSGEFDTKLSSVIKTAAIGTISSFKYDLILDQENVFDIKASFFSWLPSLRRSITHIFNEINTHSNINGTKTFEGKKIIRVTANVNHDSEMIEVNISDELSISSSAPVKVLENLRNSSLQLDKNLKALCNWSVFMDFENVGYELRVLSDKRNEWEIEPIVKLDSPNNAFINKLSFYRI